MGSKAITGNFNNWDEEEAVILMRGWEGAGISRKVVSEYRIGFVRVESYSHVDVLGDGYDLPSEFMEKRVQMQQILSQVST